MTHGRKICNALKDIRQRIADANGISYHPEECTHKGECAGTCPRCEQELADLTQEIRRRRRLGLAASVAGLAVGISSLTSCHILRPQISGRLIEGDVVVEPQRTDGMIAPTDTMLTDTVAQPANMPQDKTTGKE